MFLLHWNIPNFSMNSSITSALWIGLCTLVFTTSLAYGLSSITSHFEHFEISGGTEGSVFIKETKIPEEILFSGTEVISSIYKLNLDGYSVSVDNISFQTANDVRDKLMLINKNAIYKQSIQYTSDGSISHIKYVSNF